MVLTFIDEIKDFYGERVPNIVEIYYLIINSWLLRECRHIPSVKRVEWSQGLFLFSKELAYCIFNKWQESGRIYLTNEEFELFLIEKKYKSTPYSFKERSLVNRTSDGNIKFAHKSFLEFFVAIKALEQPGLFINPNEWDIARIFYNVFYEMQIREKEFWFVDYFTPTFFQDSDFGSFSMINAKESSAKEWLLFMARRAPAAYSIIMNRVRQGVMPYETDEDICVSNFARLFRYYIKEVQDVIQEHSATNTIIKHVDYPGADDDATHLDDNYLTSELMMRGFKETLVMPNVFALDRDLMDSFIRSTNTDFISVGCGLNRPSDVYKTISYLVKKGKAIGVVSVYLEGNDLEEHVRFINGLKSMQNRPRHIIVVVSINNEQVVFVLNDDSITFDEQTIRNFIINQTDKADPKTGITKDVTWSVDNTHYDGVVLEAILR